MIELHSLITFLTWFAKRLVVVVCFSLIGNFDIVNDIANIMVKSQEEVRLSINHDHDLVLLIEICTVHGYVSIKASPSSDA